MSNVEIVTMCWAIWESRNSLVWNQKKPSVNNVVTSMKQYLTEWNSTQLNTTQALYQFVEHGDGAQAWVRPLINEVKITVHAGTFAQNSSYGVDLLARNGDGEVREVLLAKSERYQGDVRPDFAEGVALKQALSWCKLNEW